MRKALPLALVSVACLTSGSASRLQKSLTVLIVLIMAFSAQAQQEVTVNKFTGTASVSIPLYTVQASGVSIPVALDYAATGVKVSDEGGLVGINWALTGDLLISREVHGLPDDLTESTSSPRRYGWLTRGNAPPPNPEPAVAGPACSASEATAWNRIQALEGGPNPIATLDTEPDIFS